MRLLSSCTPTVCAVAVALVCSISTVRAANIDTEGFAQDGTTTYCQGRLATDNGNPVSFPNLQVGNVNRCPVLVSLTASASTVHQGSGIDVTWKAAAQFKDIPGNIFPQAVDVANKKADEVQSSFIKACKAGTNCGTVFDGSAGAGAPTGAFDGSGNKDLQAFRFNFPDVGDFVLVGKVTLKGDPSRNVSASEFISFKKIKVVDKGTSIAPEPSPTPTSTPTSSPTPPAQGNANNTNGMNFTNMTKGSGAGEEAGTVSPVLDKAVTPSVVNEVPSEKTSTNASDKTDKGFFASHGALLGAVAGICVVVLVLGYAVAMRRRKSNVNASKQERGQTQTFRMSRSDQMDDPEPMPYIRKKSARNSNSQSVPIMSRPSTDSADGMPIDMSKRGSEMEPSFDEMDASFVEGTVTASNETISKAPFKVPKPQQHQQYRSSSEVSSDKMMLSSLDDDDRGTALYQGKQKQQSPPPPPPPERASEQERAFYKSEAWYPDASAGPQHREESTISFTEEEEVHSNSRRGFEAPSFSSEFDLTDGRTSRFGSEASVDSYAFRPSNASMAESYKSRVSRYSGFSDGDMDRESSRISGMSMYSDRNTDV